MTDVKTNLYWVILTWIALGLFGVNTLEAQCNSLDTITIQLPLGNCEINHTDLVDSLQSEGCLNAASVSPQGPFALNTTTQIIVTDQGNTSKPIYVTIAPFEVDKYPTPGGNSTLLTNFIEYPLAAGECDATKDILLDDLNITSDPIVRSRIHFYNGLNRVVNFSIGDTAYIDRVECNGFTYWTQLKILFKPTVPTNYGPIPFLHGLTTCPITIEDILFKLGYPVGQCGVGRFDISNSGPFPYGTHHLAYIKLDGYHLVKDAFVTVSPVCLIDSIGFGTLAKEKCYLDNDDIIEELGFKDQICDLTKVQLIPPGPYFDTTFTIQQVYVGGFPVCNDIKITYSRDTTFQELTTLFCNNDLNISLGPDCRVTINPDNILKGGPYCYLNYLVEVRDQQNNLVGSGNEVDITAPGEYVIKISNPRTGNSCWSNATIEDKFIYDVTCVPDTVLCYDNNGLKPDYHPAYGPDFPDVGEPAYWELTSLPNFYVVNTGNECGIRFAFYVDEVQAECVGDFKQIIHRKWGFEDPAGNFDTCTQVIYVKKTSVYDVDVDDYYANCLSDFTQFDLSGHPSPEESGYPEIKGTDHKADVCDVLKMTYTDHVFPLCGKSVKIIREWVIIDWCNNQVEDINQEIRIEDKQAPVFTSPLEDIYLNTDPFLCGVEYLELPEPEVIDCGTDNFHLEILYENYDLYGNKDIYSNGSSLIIPSLDMYGPSRSFDVFYVVTDDCGNTTRDTLTIHINDIEPPVAVCEEHTVISVSGNGLAQVKAFTFDDLSVDNCGIATYEVRKLEGECYVEESFTDVIRFCCEEVGDTLLVEFRITDYAGNSNTCMVRVNIQDKFPPRITCPPDITVDCGEDITDHYLTGEATAIDNCHFFLIEYYDDAQLNQCGEGVVYRHWSAIDRGGFEQTCVQTITVQEAEPFVMTADKFPSDLHLTGCGLDLSPKATGEPDISSSSCSNVAFSYHDSYFNTIEGACFKIVREWTVIDWCRYGSGGSTEGLWRFSQVIKIENETPPIFIFAPADTTLCLFGDDCIENITITVDALDDCSSPYDLFWFTELYYADIESPPIRTSTTNSVSYALEPGTYVVVFRVSDGCGNVSSHTMQVEIVDCEEPVVECPPFASSVVLGEFGETSLWISDFNLKGSDNCSPTEKLRYSFDPDSLVQSIRFTCNDVPNGVSSNRFIRFYAIDEQGNAGFCEMGLEIKDNSQNLCIDQDSMVINGMILTEETAEVDEVEVTLTNVSNGVSSLVTDLSGTYTFSDLTEGEDYTVSFEKNGRLDDGVTTFDLVLVAQHIVGLRALGTPYKIIASDLDNSQNVSARDLVWMRKIILGTTTSLPNDQESWRFVKKNHLFINPQNPFPYPEYLEIESLTGSQIDNDFYAIKIGDVNGTNAVSSRLKSKTRSSVSIDFLMEDVELSDDEVTRIPVRIGHDVSILGIQFSLKLKGVDYELVGLDDGLLDIFDEHFYIDQAEGRLNFSWNAYANAVDVGKEDILFYLLVESYRNQYLSDIPDWNHYEATTEAIDNSLEVRKIKWIIGEDALENASHALMVYPASPNPFKAHTTMSFEIDRASEVTFEFFDLAGRSLYKQTDYYDRGQNEIQINAQNLQHRSGVIVCRITTPWEGVTTKITLIR